MMTGSQSSTNQAQQQGRGWHTNHGAGIDFRRQQRQTQPGLALTFGEGLTEWRSVCPSEVKVTA